MHQLYGEMNMAVMKFGPQVLKNLFRKPPTRNYPAEPRQYTERTRGHLEFDPSDCILCNICGRKCPTKAIHADKAARTLTIERMSCVQCGYCEESCPKRCLTMLADYTAPNVSKTVDVFNVHEKPKPEEKKTENA